MEIEVRMHAGEKWWGGGVSDGSKMPLTESSEYALDARVNSTYNQFNGLFVSTKGRYVYFEGGAKITASGGLIKFEDLTSEPTTGEGYGTLKGAYRAAADKHFKKRRRSFDVGFAKPLYCTWAEMKTEPTQDKVLSYASSIERAGLPKSCIIIDDGWMRGYGDWRFDESKFPNPRRAVDELHALGFKVMLWLVPFVDEDAPDYERLCESGALLKTERGEVRKSEWWNGTSAVLDLSKESAREWITRVLDGLKSEYGIDCFKLDAGDAMYYEAADEGSGIGNRQSEYWAEIANAYPGSELRACVGMGGEAIMQRLSDKRSDCGEDGLGGLVGGVLQAGLCGYPYVCADMVGGGQLLDFDGLSGKDERFFVRSCQTAAFFPIMQFSYSIWNLSDGLRETVKRCCDEREAIRPYIERLMKEAEVTAEPIARPIEYEFPEAESVPNAFTIGDRYLAVCSIQPGAERKTLTLPGEGEWKRNNGIIYRAGERIEITIEPNEVCYFEKVG